MKQPDWQSCSEKELWEFVASHLARKGINTVLVGGAVVSIYSDGAYRSGDLDFVLESIFNKELPNVLKEIGFEKKDSRHFKHPQCKHLFIEFQNPPVGIGDDTDIKADRVTVDGVSIKIFSPTDCIRDRLASYIHFRAREGLDQAVLVALKQPFNMKKVEQWCLSEGAGEAFQDFKQALKKGSD
ncbi:hypothetical protein GW915_09220 [bacterium]|nr:hypothetical protein [bacterium]